jgi:hypothetical protein
MRKDWPVKGAGKKFSKFSDPLVNSPERTELGGIAACRLRVLDWMDIPDALARLVSVLQVAPDRAHAAAACCCGAVRLGAPPLPVSEL